mmetsp:Transcript_17989/g.30626  ORF Transcript_17989/g.30626 Transcript_17989/m.30626 type:complete len:263 (-) Transcript_17989:1723-2511(-)
MLLTDGADRALGGLEGLLHSKVVDYAQVEKGLPLDLIVRGELLDVLVDLLGLEHGLAPVDLEGLQSEVVVVAELDEGVELRLLVPQRLLEIVKGQVLVDVERGGADQELVVHVVHIPGQEGVLGLEDVVLVEEEGDVEDGRGHPHLGQLHVHEGRFQVPSLLHQLVSLLEKLDVGADVGDVLDEDVGRDAGLVGSQAQVVHHSHVVGGESVPFLGSVLEVRVGLGEAEVDLLARLAAGDGELSVLQVQRAEVEDGVGVVVLT